MQQEKKKQQIRLNFLIKAPSVRVVQNGKQLGIMPINQARQIAEEAGLDLVEIVPNAKPPVCEIKDYNKWKYEEKIREKENERKQRESQIHLKEIRLRPTIANADVETKIKQAKGFLEDGMNVQFNLQFKGQRELSHKEQGFIVINKIIADLEKLGTPERSPKFEGNRIICKLIPVKK